MPFIVKRVELDGDDVINSAELPEKFDYVEEAKTEAYKQASSEGKPTYNPEQGFYTINRPDRIVRFITVSVK